MPVEISKDRYLKFLWETGQFWDRSKPDLLNVAQDDIYKLDLTHKLVQQATASWQALDINFDVLSFILHLRGIIADGDIGPVTAAMLEMPRCAMPDHAPPPSSTFHYDDPDLQAAVESYQEYAEAYTGGSGSWPKGCDPNNPNVHSVVVGIDTSNASTHQKSIMDDVLKYVEQTEAEIGQSVRHVRDGSVNNPQHSVKFEYIAGGVIGYAYFPRANSCNQTVKARIDNSFNASLPVLAEMLTHEYKGHSDGLQHSRGGIMNSSIGRPTKRASWIGDPHHNTKKKYFGGVAIPGGPTDPPPPPPPTGDHNGVFLFQGKLLKIKVYE